ncbi:MAG: hypothetical protein GY814_14090 [Gammaproteobacteria bacterium]|nr:hypothetical protein [Gammaproteobacteria bacterium]
MNRFHLEGRNSGGYSSTREIEFDGDIKEFRKPEPTGNYPLMTELWYSYTYSDGRVIEDQGDLLQQIINECNWNEAFSTQTITKLPVATKS